jgi:hypothetical protein
MSIAMPRPRGYIRFRFSAYAQPLILMESVSRTSPLQGRYIWTESAPQRHLRALHLSLRHAQPFPAKSKPVRHRYSPTIQNVRGIKHQSKGDKTSCEMKSACSQSQFSRTLMLPDSPGSSCRLLPLCHWFWPSQQRSSCPSPPVGPPCHRLHLRHRTRAHRLDRPHW